MSTTKRKRRSPEQVVKALAEGESMLAAGKSSAEVYQTRKKEHAKRGHSTLTVLRALLL